MEERTEYKATTADQTASEPSNLPIALRQPRPTLTFDYFGAPEDPGSAFDRIYTAYEEAVYQFNCLMLGPEQAFEPTVDTFFRIYCDMTESSRLNGLEVQTTVMAYTTSSCFHQLYKQGSLPFPVFQPLVKRFGWLQRPPKTIRYEPMPSDEHAACLACIHSYSRALLILWMDMQLPEDQIAEILGVRPKEMVELLHNGINQYCCALQTAYLLKPA